MAPTLMESLNQALSRLKVFERELKKAKESIRKKDVEIQELRLQLRQGQPGGGGAAPASRSSDSHETAKYVSEMRAELAEMKAFLNDYGMVWIGGNNKKVGEEGEAGAKAKAPNSSKELTINPENVKLIEKSVGELNQIVDASQRDTVYLVLYKDGIVFNGSSFRTFGDKTAQRVVCDLADGYFPQELRSTYPEGVRISLSLKHSQTHREATEEAKPKAKPGKPKFRSNIRQLGELDDGSGGEGEGSTEGFLDRIPKTVIQNGKIVQMREDIAGLVGAANPGKPEKTNIHSLFTQKLNMAELSRQYLVESDEEEDGGPAEEQEEAPRTVIQIKREDGMQTYVLKLPPWATIRDVRRALDSHRRDEGGRCDPEYALRSAFPPQIYSDETQTLEQAGLVPNATLFMMKQGG